jgi:hypothetical protein
MSAPNKIFLRMIRARKEGMAGHVACTEDFIWKIWKKQTFIRIRHMDTP